MRHVTILRSEADLVRMEFVERPMASFYVGQSGIERVEFGDEQIPRTVAVFDPTADVDPVGGVQRITLESDPLRWAELLPTAYRSGDYSVAVVETPDASGKRRDEGEAEAVAHLEALPG